jgi:RNA polymerase sigma factor (sigma-70 family)
LPCILFDEGVREFDRLAHDVKPNRNEIVAWVGSNVVPHERDLRARLRRIGIADEEIDDVIQDAYVSISRLDSVTHIHSGRAYFFTVARMAFLQRIRRDRVVRIDSITELEALTIADEQPSAERRVSARQELDHVRSLIAALPDRCRQIFEMRRIDGVSQREIANRLGIAEHIVEAQSTRGLKLILKALAGDGDAQGLTLTELKAAERDRQRN